MVIIQIDQLIASKCRQLTCLTPDQNRRGPRKPSPSLDQESSLTFCCKLFVCYFFFSHTNSTSVKSHASRFCGAYSICVRASKLLSSTFFFLQRVVVRYSLNSSHTSRWPAPALYSPIQGANINLCKFTIELKSIFVFENYKRSGWVGNPLVGDHGSGSYNLHGDICYNIILLLLRTGDGRW